MRQSCSSLLKMKRERKDKIRYFFHLWIDGENDVLEFLIKSFMMNIILILRSSVSFSHLLHKEAKYTKVKENDNLKLINERKRMR
jgi:hypothetical protein